MPDTAQNTPPVSPVENQDPQPTTSANALEQEPARHLKSNRGNKRKNLFLIMMAVVILAVGAVVGRLFFGVSPLSDSRRQELTSVTVRLKWLHQAQFAGIYTAAEKGYYHDAGLDVTMSPFDFETRAIQEVLEGRAQFGVAGAEEILLAREEGKKVKAVAVIYKESPVVTYTLADSGITQPSDFVGKTVGIPPAVTMKAIISTMLREQQINSQEDVNLVEIGFNPDELLSGEVDVATGYSVNEVLALEEQGYDVTVISPADYEINLYADVIFTTEEMIENEPELVQAFVSATIEGWEYALENQEEAVSYTLLYENEGGEPLDRDHELELLARSAPLIKPSPGSTIGFMNFANWQRLYNVFLDYGAISESTNPTDAFTNEFVDNS